MPGPSRSRRGAVKTVKRSGVGRVGSREETLGMVPEVITQRSTRNTELEPLLQ